MPRALTSLAGAALSTVLALGGCAETAIEPPATAATSRAVLDRVTDGDTIRVRVGGRVEKVRLIGLDTPEVFGGVEVGGRQASASLKQLARPGDRVTLTRDPTQDDSDRFRRLLRVATVNGRDLALEQIRRGWGAAYVFRDPFKRLGRYRAAERAARAARRGVWGLGGDFHRPIG